MINLLAQNQQINSSPGGEDAWMGHAVFKAWQSAVATRQVVPGAAGASSSKKHQNGEWFIMMVNEYG